MIEKEKIHALTDNFEDFVQVIQSGVNFWLARDLQHLLGYIEWRNFQNAIFKAKTACEVSHQNISDHFVDINKMEIAKRNKLLLHKLVKMKTLHSLEAKVTKHFLTILQPK